MTKTMKQLAQDALNVQDACNLSGVVISFAAVVQNLRLLLPSAGTDEINGHPICRLWADKIAHLTGTQSLGNDRVMAAYTWAHTEIEVKS